MDFIWESITDWLKEILISGIVSNLSGMFDSTNEQVGNIVGQVGMTPQSWNSGIFTMIQNLSNTVILPIAGAILAIVMTLELIQLVTDRNNLNDVDTWMFFKWVFKSACAVVIVTHTWDIVMGIFEASQSVVSSAAGVIVGQTNIDISSVVGGLESRLNEMELGPLFGLWFQSLFVGLCTWAITICIFIITYGRMTFCAWTLRSRFCSAGRICPVPACLRRTISPPVPFTLAGPEISAWAGNSQRSAFYRFSPRNSVTVC